MDRPALEIRLISASATRPLRAAILRPEQPEHELVYPGDDDAASLHVGAFDSAGNLRGVATLLPQSPDDDAPADAGDWRLRGMAVVPEARRGGVGAALLAACEAHAIAHGGQRIWFNARVDALAFYQALGYTVIGDPYDLPGIGLHCFAERRLGAAEEPGGADGRRAPGNRTMN